MTNENTPEDTPVNMTTDDLIKMFDSRQGRFSPYTSDAGFNATIDALIQKVRNTTKPVFGLDLSDPTVADIVMRTIVAVVKLGMSSVENTPDEVLGARMAKTITDPQELGFHLALLEGAELLTRAAASSVSAPDLTGFETIELPDDLKAWIEGSEA